MFGLFGDKTAREVRRLNKDAPELVEFTYQSFRSELVRSVALETRKNIDRARRIYGTEAIDLKRAVAEYQTFHREAKRTRDQVALTAFTLVLIYLRAELQGAACGPARAAIDGFMGEWAHAAGCDDKPEERS